MFSQILCLENFDIFDIFPGCQDLHPGTIQGIKLHIHKLYHPNLNFQKQDNDSLKLDIEFDARLLFGENEKEVSSLKKSLLGIFKKKGFQNNIKGIHVDSGHNPSNIGAAKIKVSFKADKKPEMVSRIIDSYISKMDDTSPKKIE